MSAAPDTPLSSVSLLSPATFADPYPVARLLREQDPVHWSRELGSWVLTRYADVSSCLHDPRLSADRLPPLDRLAEFGLEPLRPLMSTVRRMFLFLDPPQHTRLRRTVNRAFTRPSIEAWRLEIERLVVTLLDRLEGRESAELLAEVAQPLPLAMIRLVLGYTPLDPTWPALSTPSRAGYNSAARSKQMPTTSSGPISRPRK